MANIEEKRRKISRVSQEKHSPPVLFNPWVVYRQLLRQMREAAEGAIDPFGVMMPMMHAQLAWWTHPQEFNEHMAGLSADIWRLQWHTALRMFGLPSEDPIPPNKGDMRFVDPVWTDEASWDLLKEWYLAFTRHVQDMLYDTPGLSDKERRKAAFWWRKWLNAVAPTNFFWTNPVAIRKAVESNGQSLINGMHNLLEDMQRGDIRMTSPEDFQVGGNLATTPGAVIFRNRLLEIIHYTPTQPKVHAEPVVIITPWINKYYVLDLTPRKSMVRFLLEQGFDVFITSWKNPDASMRDVTFDDYLTEGVEAAINTALRFTGAKKVQTVGYCIGGTALSMYMAWANRCFAAEDVPVSSWTLFASLVDFRAPGDIEVFIDERAVRHLTRRMAEKGYLEGKEMATAFRLLRSNSLIWHYVVYGWLYGEPLAPFDVLYWNMDATRMPYAMHAWYLEALYLHNRLVEKDALVVAGEPLDLGRITQPLYAVAAHDDHIAPWRETFRINRLVSGPKRYVLSSSGHILGIVNPVVNPPKRMYWVADPAGAETASAWRARAQEHSGSWWEDWMDWLRLHAGKRVPARETATEAFPALSPAPGTYVLER